MERIIKDLAKFIRRYHNVLLIRNLIFFLALSIILIYSIVYIENILWLDTKYRRVIFFSSLFFILIFGVRFFLLPYLRVSKYYKNIDKYSAADIIGRFFPDISDRFRNLLELYDYNNVSRENSSLVVEAIAQKSAHINKFSFLRAIDYTRLKEILFFFAPVFCGALLLTFSNPKSFSFSLSRIVNFSTFYEKPAPFQFVLINDNLTGFIGDKEKLQLRFTGDVIPNSASIELNGNTYPMRKIKSDYFEFEIKQLKGDFKFRFEANGYYSELFRFSVLSKPKIIAFVTEIDYPKYTGYENEIVKNSTDYIVPDGSILRWKFNTQNSTKYFIYNQTVIDDPVVRVINKSIFTHSLQARKSQVISFLTENDNIISNDTISMSISIIPDNYPSISVNEIFDSLFISRAFFVGNISDDYGINKLTFNFKKQNDDEYNQIDVPFVSFSNDQRFYFTFDFSTVDNWRENMIEYFFTVTDNDQINGNKSTKSLIRHFNIPTKKKLDQTYEFKKDNIYDLISNISDQATQLNEQLENFKQDIVSKKSLGWEEKNKFKQITEKHEQLESLLEKLNNQNIEKNTFEEMLKNISPELLEKQKQIEELFEKLFDEEMKEMIQELQELFHELNKDNIRDQLEKIQLRSEDIKKNIENNYELLKQLEFEKKVDDLLKSIEDLKEQLKDLSIETEEKSHVKDDLLNRQEDINKIFEKLKDDINILQNDNDQLNNPIDFPDTDSLTEEIDNILSNAKDDIAKNKNKNASQKQKQGAEKLDELSSQIQQAMSLHEEESLAEDIDNIKMILKNLINISFLQEKNINLTKSLTPRDNRVNDILLNQKKVHDRFQIVEDSLMALSKRQAQIQPIISKDINEIKALLQMIDYSLLNGRIYQANSAQQYLMKHVNNLALLLIESLEQMNQEMMQMKSGEGKGKCNSKNKGDKPGDKPSPSTLKNMQEQLNQQIESLMKQMEKGGLEGSFVSEQLAKLAAKQEAVRRQLQQYSESLKQMGETDLKLINEIMQKMEETEMDLINKNLTSSTINRQKELIVRLLESEKAQMEREKDEKRTSKSGKVFNNSNLDEFFQYNRNRSSSEEVIKFVPLQFNSFYRSKINRFYIDLNN